MTPRDNPLKLLPLIVREIQAGRCETVIQVPSGKPIEPHEFWIVGALAWVRADGTWLSTGGDNRVAFRPSLYWRIRIRRALNKRGY